MPRRDSDGPHFDFERAALQCGQVPVCGIDEAGRGPWAGPVVAAAVILDPNNVPIGLNDSKKLTPEARERLFGVITATAQIGIGMADVERIDRDNILQANFWAMAQAMAQLNIKPVLALIDGNRTPPIPCAVQTIVGGDALCASIAAASIIAKVTRDRLMIALDTEYPGYGFAAHKGYGTPQHLSALARLGPSPHHRRSFAPVRQLCR
jgi:ribonuclease HII